MTQDPCFLPSAGCWRLNVAALLLPAAPWHIDFGACAGVGRPASFMHSGPALPARRCSTPVPTCHRGRVSSSSSSSLAAAGSASGLVAAGSSSGGARSSSWPQRRPQRTIAVAAASLGLAPAAQWAAVCRAGQQQRRRACAHSSSSRGLTPCWEHLSACARSPCWQWCAGQRGAIELDGMHDVRPRGSSRVFSPGQLLCPCALTHLMASAWRLNRCFAEALLLLQPADPPITRLMLSLCCAVACLLQGPADFGPVALRAFLQAVTSALLMNICIVGINQVLLGTLLLGVGCRACFAAWAPLHLGAVCHPCSLQLECGWHSWHAQQLLCRKRRRKQPLCGRG